MLPPGVLGMLPLLVLLLGGLPSATAGQETESPLSPAGRLRIEVAPSFLSWDHRFGLRMEGGRTVEETEPLGFDLTREDASTWFPGVRALEEELRGLLDDPGYSGMLGRTRAHVTADRIRVPLRVDLGVVDWLTVGATVPFVKTRTEIAVAYDSIGANLGIAPAPGVVANWLGELASAADAVALEADDLCAGDPTSEACLEAVSLVAELRDFQEGLEAAYEASPLFPTQGSTAGTVLLERSELLAERARSVGVDLFDPELPLGQQVAGEAELEALVQQEFGDPGFGNRVGIWELGDVEVHAAIRLLEGVRRNPAGEAQLRYQVGAGGLVRFGTGTVDDPRVALDQGSGDGQMDLEGRIFANLTWRRLGLWTDLRHGIQRPTTLPRRVGPPDQVFRTPASLQTVEWTPGDYTSLEVSPRFHLTEELAVSGGYRLWSKGEDRFAAATPAGPEGPDPSLLALETEERMHQVGAALVFSTVDAWREGRTSLPFEARFTVRWAVAGSGGQTPQAFRTDVGLRIYHRLWGR